MRKRDKENRRKAVVFVAHVQKHLDKYETYDSVSTPGYRKIPRGKVGCKICELSIDRIFAVESRRSEGKP